MHLAYSALRKNPSAGNQQTDRYQGYLAACQKHQETIAEIQKYLPGWRPRMPVGNSEFEMSISK